MTRGIRFCMPVRYVVPDGWEAFCGTCRSWWPLELEFWYSTIHGGKCRACHNVTGAERQRIDRARDERKRTADRDRARRYRASWTEAEREAVRDKNRRWLAEHREENARRCRESRARRKSRAA